MSPSRMAFRRHNEQVLAHADAHQALMSADDAHRRRRGPIIAAVVAALVIVTIGALAFRPGGQDDPIAGGPTTTEAQTDAPTTIAEPPPSTIAAPPTTQAPIVVPPSSPADDPPNDPRPTGPVASHRVVDVASDDVLNVRWEPGVDGALFAELAPNYAGVLATGVIAETDDGATWMEIQLLQPTQLFGLDEPLHGGPAIGWVNGRYLEAIDGGNPVGFDRLPCGAGQLGIVPLEGGGVGQFPADHIYALDHAAGDTCDRVVITLGARFDANFRFESTTARPADSVPDGVQTNEEFFTVELDGVFDAFETEVSTPHGPVLVTGIGDGRLSVLFTFPVSEPLVHVLGDEGRVVMDYVPRGATLDTTSDLVVVTGTHDAAPGSYVVEGGTVAVLGWARPFEATLGIEVYDADGNLVEARFTGSDYLGEVVGTDYFVMTTGWVTSWGWFDVTIADLAPGEYEVFFFSGGADIPTGLRVPVTVTG